MKYEALCDAVFAKDNGKSLFVFGDQKKTNHIIKTTIDRKPEDLLFQRKKFFERFASSKEDFVRRVNEGEARAREEIYAKRCR